MPGWGRRRMLYRPVRMRQQTGSQQCRSRGRLAHRYRRRPTVPSLDRSARSARMQPQISSTCPTVDRQHHEPDPAQTGRTPSSERGDPLAGRSAEDGRLEVADDRRRPRTPLSRAASPCELSARARLGAGLHARVIGRWTARALSAWQETGPGRRWLPRPILLGRTDRPSCSFEGSRRQAATS